MPIISIEIMKTSPIYSTVNIAEIEQINAGWA